MKKMICSSALSFLLASAIYAASPVINISVKQKAGGKVIKQVSTDASGSFSVGTLPAGAYTLEFRSRNAEEVKDKGFSLSVNGTKTTGKQTVTGKSLVTGVALTIEVAPASTVTGQIATGANVKKKMVWVPPALGSNQPGHWVEEGSAEESRPEHAARSGRIGFKICRKSPTIRRVS
ncbi:MAG TPA: carboxypeptidase-like regulatory domain-containing protein [Chthoniobacterales bacterium]|nr:carboxypeptidase-like regulatory domain-containing protein [Chthoniobacterales bacterium]